VRKNPWQTTRKALTVADNCAGSVSGNMGDRTAVTGASVTQVVRRGSTEAGTLAVGDWAASDIAKVPTIQVGQIANCWQHDRR
jgi:hypothetical protein